ncbi:hypothetical protein [Streptomyces sp. N35]|uniref:hypothetical protein n=1 Tax=Streptomyces sp. N35 TaxID=2795730 RepID=UPI0018F778CE|nr:hypothetical protein [Streptomyces sp. N35]
MTTSKKAVTGKGSDGWCAGHAWLRVQYRAGNWSAWKHGTHQAVITNADGNIMRSQHKGCGDCAVYKTEK